MRMIIQRIFDLILCALFFITAIIDIGLYVKIARSMNRCNRTLQFSFMFIVINITFIVLAVVVVMVSFQEANLKDYSTSAIILNICRFVAALLLCINTVVGEWIIANSSTIIYLLVFSLLDALLSFSFIMSIVPSNRLKIKD